ncbi:MAG: hypothetical protein ACLQPD_04555 [Desulfomonilaceae bacterium]
MEKKKISAKDALADIRSGMSDADLMSKYLLSNAGLQSLFDKLVTAGYIDLGEILARTPTFLGTVDIPESFPPAEAIKTEDGRQLSKSRAATRVNAQEAARDIRSGMDDFALMQKYRLSYKNLPSLFKKLMDVGLLQQTDIDHRNLGFENTVALSEDMLSISAAFAVLGSPRPAAAAEKGRHRPTVTYNKATLVQGQELTAPTIEEKIKSAILPREKTYTGVMPTKPDDRSFALPWYENPSIVMLLLVLFFPLGLYACYRNSSLSTGVKTFAILACLFLLISLIVISLMPDWLFSRFL